MFRASDRFFTIAPSWIPSGFSPCSIQLSWCGIIASLCLQTFCRPNTFTTPLKIGAFLVHFPLHDMALHKLFSPFEFLNRILSHLHRSVGDNDRRLRLLLPHLTHMSLFLSWKHLYIWCSVVFLLFPTETISTRSFASSLGLFKTRSMLDRSISLVSLVSRASRATLSEGTMSFRTCLSQEVRNILLQHNLLLLHCHICLSCFCSVRFGPPIGLSMCISDADLYFCKMKRNWKKLHLPFLSDTVADKMWKVK